MIDIIQGYSNFFIYGVKVTLISSILSIVFGFLLGTILGFVRTIQFSYNDSTLTKVIKKIFYYIVTFYIEFFRGTPLLVQLYFIYFGIGALPIFQSTDRFFWAVVAMSLNSAAYVAEIIRAGIQSVDKGQYEAARSLGMNNMQASLRVIYPQAIKNIIPALGNEFIVIIKDTSIFSVIGVADLMYKSKQVVADTWDPINTYFISAIIYFVLTFTLSRVLVVVENRMGKGDKRS